MVLHRMLKLYHRILFRTPYVSQAIQTGILLGTGDMICQKIIEHRPAQKMDFTRTIKFACIGFFFEGPLLRIWFGILNKLIGSGGKTVAVKKVLMDQVIFGPIFYFSFLSIVSFTQGKDWDNIKADLKLNYFDVLSASYLIWPWVQLVNFYFVPLRYQVLLVQMFALFWNTYLAWKTNKYQNVNKES